MPVKDVSAYLGFSGDFNADDVTRFFDLHPSWRKQKGAMEPNRTPDLSREHRAGKVNSISVWIASTGDMGRFLNVDEHVSALHALFADKTSGLDAMSASGNPPSVRITVSFQNEGCVGIANDSLVKIMKIGKRLDFSLFDVDFDPTRPIDAARESFKLELFGKNAKTICSKISSIDCDGEKFLASFLSDIESEMNGNGKDVTDCLRITYPVCGGGDFP